MPVRSNLDAIRVVAPKPLNAVAGAPATNGGNLKDNLTVGTPLPENVVIVINGVNLVDIIADLQAAVAP
jgi:hypothetical protein